MDGGAGRAYGHAVEIDHCRDCVDAPTGEVAAGEPPGLTARLSVCGDRRCVDEATRWVELATGRQPRLVGLTPST